LESEEQENKKLLLLITSFFYTLVGSVLMLLSIFYIYSITGTTDYLTLLNYNIDKDAQNIIFLCFFASLAVKIPKFPFHI
jgi:NADH:ubiquinone oxidoreductase subunit 4 (subunit M)